MLELILILAGIASAFLLFFWAASTYTSRTFARIAAQHADNTQWIIQNGTAPPEWTAAQLRRLAALTTRGVDDDRLERLRSRYAEVLVARLERHLRYVERSTVVAADSERRYLGDRIREVGREWEQGGWERIVDDEALDAVD